MKKMQLILNIILLINAKIVSFIKSNNIFISLISIVKIYDINQINISCINLGLFNFIIEYMNNNLGMFIIGLIKEYDCLK